MLKKSTLLFLSVFLLLFIGLNDYGYGCHGGKPPHGACGDKGDKGGDEGEYSVVISGDVSGGSNPLFPWHRHNRNKPEIHQAILHVGVDHDPALKRVGELTDLSFFVDRFNALDLAAGVAGSNCFRDGPLFTMDGATVNRGRGGTAESIFVFRASTEDLGDDYMPLYSLSMFGDTVPSEDWPPSDAGTTMIMTDWVLKVENESQDVRNISCLGEFVLGDDPFLVHITVTRTNE